MELESWKVTVRDEMEQLLRDTHGFFDRLKIAHYIERGSIEVRKPWGVIMYETLTFHHPALTEEQNNEWSQLLQHYDLEFH